MNILQVNKFYYERGGAEQYFFDLCQLLEAHGHQIIPFSTKDDRNLPTPYDKYFVSGMDLSEPNKLSWFKKIKYASRFFYNFEARKKLKKLLKNEKIDLVHLHNIYHHLSPSILTAIKKRGIPVVMTIHDYKLLCPNYTFMNKGQVDETLGRGWYWRCVKEKCVDNSRAYSLLATLEMIFHHKIMKYYEKYVDLFIAPSEFVRDLFVSFGWDKNKIIVLPHFLPLSIKPLKESLAVPEVPRFATVGRMSEEKGTLKLIEYWCSQQVPYELHLFGTGPEAQRLSEIVEAYNNQKVFFHGWLPRAILYQKIREEITAIIVPSIFYEIFGLVLTEAFANSIPAVASSVGALPELISQSGAGVLFDWQDHDSLIKALQEVQNPLYRQKAINCMQNNFLPENYYLKLISVYQSLLKS